MRRQSDIALRAQDQLALPQQAQQGKEYLLSRDVQTPLAHASPSDPQLCPFGENTSAGHVDELPVHISGWSQLTSLAGRHTCVDGANEHVSVQHALLAGSH